MIFRTSLSAAVIATLLALGTAAPADAHGGGMAQPYHQGWHQGWHMGIHAMNPVIPHGGMMHPGKMYGCPMAGGYGASGYGGMHHGMMMGPAMTEPGTMGPGMMGPGMMGPGMTGQGMMMVPQGRPSMVGPRHMVPGYGPGGDDAPMMGPGMGQGMTGPGSRGGMMMPPDAAVVSVEDVTRMLEHRLAWQANPHVKLGKVEEKDDDTIVAEIVTQDGSLVERLEVDRRSGWMRMVP